MTEEERKEVLLEAIETYGEENQFRMAIEEMAELTKAICKLERAETVAERDMAVGNVIEEIGDVQIMLDQLRIMVKSNTKAVEDVKLKRLAGRIKREKLKKAIWRQELLTDYAEQKEKEERANE